MDENVFQIDNPLHWRMKNEKIASEDMFFVQNEKEKKRKENMQKAWKKNVKK